MIEIDAAASERTAYVVAVCNLKGGTGKSTLSVNLACAFAELGARVALVDNDEQGSAAAWGAAGRLPIRCLHLPLPRPEGIGPWITDLLAQRLGHDVIFVDFPAGLAPTLAVTLLMSSMILVPCAPNELEIAATRRMMQHVAKVRAERPHDPPDVLVVPNRVIGIEHGIAEFLARLTTFGEELTPPVRFSGDYDQAFGEGLWVGAHRPGSSAHEELLALAERLGARLETRPPAVWPPARTALARPEPALGASGLKPRPPAPPAAATRPASVAAVTPFPALRSRPASSSARGEAPTLAKLATPGNAKVEDPKVIYLDEAMPQPPQRSFMRWALRLVGSRAAL
jgi:chromosome partitioning protein